MHDAARVRVGQPFGDLRSVAQRVDERRRPPRQDVAEILSLDEFHDDQRRGARLEQFVDLADVRMVERGGGERLGSQPQDGVGVGGVSFANRLQRNGAIQAGVDRLPDDAHTAAAEAGDDAIVADELGDQMRAFPLYRRGAIPC